MKKILMLLLLSLLLIFGTACSQEDATNDRYHAQELDEETNEKDELSEQEAQKNDSELDEATKENRTDETNEQQQQNDEKTDIDKNDPTKTEIDLVQSLKNKDLIGIAINDVEELMGKPTVEDKNAILHAWRYDFPTSDYVFENQLNAVDVEGLYNEKMAAQLMVFFENNLVTSYSIYYLKEDEIMQYRKTKDGEEEYSASQD